MTHPCAPPGRADDRGFTLIELVVVIVILGVLTGVAVPSYLGQRRSARDAAAQSDLRNALVVLKQCRLDYGWYPLALTNTWEGLKADWCDVQGSGQKGTFIPVTTGVTFTYRGDAAAEKQTTAYVVSTQATDGTGAVYCYASATGGPVKKLTPPATAPTSYATACP